MQNPFSTVDIVAKKWFDKINGNTYFSCQVTTDFGLPTERRFQIPFQYGYGNMYEQKAVELLQSVFGIPSERWQLRERGIIVRTTCYDNCKKRELCNPTKKDIANAKKKGVDVYPFFEITNGFPY